MRERVKDVGVIILILILLAIGVVCGLKIYSLMTEEYDTKITDCSPIDVEEAVNESLKDYSGKSIFEFKEPEVNSTPEEMRPAVSRDSYNLYLGDNLYFEILLPSGTQVVTDYNKFVYAKDSTVNISIISGVSTTEFAKQVNIKNTQSLSPSVIRTEAGVKGPQEAAKYIADGKAIVVRTYNNPEAFATILWSLENNMYVKREPQQLKIKEKTETEDGTKILNGIPQYTGFKMSAVDGFGTSISLSYTYEDGYLCLVREFLKYDDVRSLLGTRATLVEGRVGADAVYENERIYYAEIGKCTIGVYKIDFNTAISMFGIGEEARFNIASILNAY